MSLTPFGRVLLAVLLACLTVLVSHGLAMAFGADIELWLTTIMLIPAVALGRIL